VLLFLHHHGNQGSGLEVLGIGQPQGSQHLGHVRRNLRLGMEIHSLQVVEDLIEIIELPQQWSFSQHPVSLRRPLSPQRLLDGPYLGKGRRYNLRPSD